MSKEEDTEYLQEDSIRGDVKAKLQSELQQ